MNGGTRRRPRCSGPTPPAVATAGVALLLAVNVHAQVTFGPGATRSRVFETRIAGSPHFGKQMVAPLPPAIQERFLRARALREAGRLDFARDSLTRLLVVAPRHPVVLVELARVHEARQAWREVEALAVEARATARDSLLLGAELVQAFARQGRARDAAHVVVQAWISDGRFLDWARTWIDTLAVRDPRAVRDLLRRTTAVFPERTDLVRVAATIECRLGDPAVGLRLLAASERTGRGMPLRWAFAEEMLLNGTGSDSAHAGEALIQLAGDRDANPDFRISAGRRAWDVERHRRTPAEAAARVARALEDVPAQRWGPGFAMPVIRALREAGQADQARALMRALGEGLRAVPEVALEAALGDLRDGPTEPVLENLRALADTLDEATFFYAEALFFSGQPDSALRWYGAASKKPASPFAGAALERLYLIEDGKPAAALPLFGRMAYESWRGDTKRALALADSLVRSIDRGAVWVHASLALAGLLEATGEGKAALEPLLAVADGLPEDRLASVARQRAGDVLRIWHKDDAAALEQYEECLARYPRAWNAPEVRRWVETLRRRRF